MMQRSAWPEAADPDAAARLIERFSDHGEEAAALAAASPGRAMLRAFGGGSPFLSDLAVREHATVLEAMRQGPDAALAQVEASLDALDPRSPRATLAAALRHAKRRAALITALADIGGLWGLGQVTRALSWLAETALRPRRRPPAARGAQRARNHASRPRQPRAGERPDRAGHGQARRRAS